MTGPGSNAGEPGYPEQPVPRNPYAPVDYPEYPPGYPPPGPAGYPPPGPAGYPPAPPGYPPPYPGAAGYPVPGPYDPYAPGPPVGTNGMAIASLVTSLTGLFFCGVPAVVGLALGIIAMGQCRRTGQQGHGIALAGTIIGAVITVLAVIALTIWVIAMIAVGTSTY